MLIFMGLVVKWRPPYDPYFGKRTIGSCYVDDDFAIVEKRLLDQYADLFGLSKQRSDEIYRVVNMIRDFSLFQS